MYNDYITVHITAYITLQCMLQNSPLHRSPVQSIVATKDVTGKGDLDGNGNYWVRRLTGIRGDMHAPADDIRSSPDKLQ